jgi:hypothetical protein
MPDKSLIDCPITELSLALHRAVADACRGEGWGQAEYLLTVLERRMAIAKGLQQAAVDEGVADAGS